MLPFRPVAYAMVYANRYDRLYVEQLPRRTRHALAALSELTHSHTPDRQGMPTAAEVCVWDSEALSVRSTAAGLRHAARLGLCAYVPRGPGYWLLTNRGHNLRYALDEVWSRDLGGT